LFFIDSYSFIFLIYLLKQGGALWMLASEFLFLDLLLISGDIV